MQFGIMFANTGHGSTPAGATALAQAAEQGGFTTAWTVDHVVVPSGYDSTYPYDPSGKMAGGAEEFDLPDPLIWMAWAAATTTTLRFGTGILIANLRNPLITAKQVATLDHLSGGRIDLGVGVGWLREEFDALGVAWEQRGRRLDEYVDAMRALWTMDRAEYHGEFVDFEQCISRPRPAQGTIPIAIGGHTEAAARRAGRLGDAFFPGLANTEEMAGLIDVMKRAADAAGRDGGAIKIYAGGGGKPGPGLDARIEALAALGVDQVILPAFSPDRLPEIGNDLVSRFA
jgi:probable F420-dependent oxidoreductase